MSVDLEPSRCPRCGNGNTIFIRDGEHIPGIDNMVCRGEQCRNQPSHQPGSLAPASVRRGDSPPSSDPKDDRMESLRRSFREGATPHDLVDAPALSRSSLRRVP